MEATFLHEFHGNFEKGFPGVTLLDFFKWNFLPIFIVNYPYDKFLTKLSRNFVEFVCIHSLGAYTYHYIPHLFCCLDIIIMY